MVKSHPVATRTLTEGQQRAMALVPFFLGNSLVNQSGLPIAIYVPTPSESGSRRRSLMTVTPLANAINLTPDTAFDNNSDDLKTMCDAIKSDPAYNGKSVLICWEHSSIPEIAGLLDATGYPKNWNSDDYDRLWLITYDGSISFANLPQQLLYGDATK